MSYRYDHAPQYNASPHSDGFNVNTTSTIRLIKADKDADKTEATGDETGEPETEAMTTYSW